jgi:hypothetical protein
MLLETSRAARENSVDSVDSVSGLASIIPAARKSRKCNPARLPGLMPGLAGIGHFCLRLYDPAGVPSVLLVTPDQPAVRLAPVDAVPGP